MDIIDLTGKTPRASDRTSSVPAFFSTHVSRASRFYLDLNPPKHLPLAVVCGGLEHCTPEYVVQRASFPFNSIEYVVHGEGKLKLKGRTYDLRPGRLFAYGPGVPHHIVGDGRQPLVKYFVNFGGKRSGALLASCRLKPGTVSEIFPPHALQPLFDELVHAGAQVRRPKSELCVKLLECLAIKIADSKTPLEGVETLAFRTYHDCRRYIDDHFLRLRTLRQIAAECHINSAYLCRLFRRYDHQSPYQYLLRLKMRHCAEQLQQPGALVKQVAEEAGFADPFHFSRLFRSVLGLSPNTFRKLR